MSTAKQPRTLTPAPGEDERLLQLESALALLLTEAGLGTLQRRNVALGVRALFRTALSAGTVPGAPSSAPGRCLHERSGHAHGEAVICLACYVDTCHAAEAAWRAAREAYQTAGQLSPPGNRKDPAPASTLRA